MWFVVLAFFCIPIRSPLLTTLAVVENTSQVRSIEGRVNKWKDAGQLFFQYPVTGVGSGNFALRSEPISNQRESVYTGRSINSWLQLASEKGIVGISVYGLLFIVWMIGVIKILRLRKKDSFFAMICSTGVIVCLLRETTFSTIFDIPILFLLIVLMIWLSSTVTLNSNKINIHLRWVTLFIIPIIFFGILQTRQKNATLNSKLFVRAHTKGEDGWEKLQKSLRSSPNNALLHANEGIYLLSQIPDYDSLIFLNTHTPDSTLFKAKKSFEKAVALNPADASFQSNLGVINFAIGDTLNGLKYLNRALILAPHQSIYHILHGMTSSNESNRHFVHAVYYSPDMLDSKWFTDLCKQDSSRAFSIVNDAQVMLSDSLVCRKNDYLLQARLAKVLLHQDKINEAEKLLFEVTLAMPNLNRPWMMLGDIAFLRNDAIALRYYERAIQLDPSDAFAKIRIGDCYLEKGNLSKAFEYYIDGLRAYCFSPTEHSRRSFTIYNTYTVSNDVLPPAFYWHISPYINVRKLADLITQGYEQEGNTSKAALYRQLGNKEIKVHELFNK
jgi:Lipid A core - O-antigen ligase and related enzymes